MSTQGCSAGCRTKVGACPTGQQSRHVALLWSLDSIASHCILKAYSFPVPLIRNANDVMKLDSLVAFSS